MDNNATMSLLEKGSTEKEPKGGDETLSGLAHREQDRINALLLDEDWQAWYERGLRSLQKGDTAGATKNFQRSVQINPTHAIAWIGLGNAHFSDLQIAEAKTAFQKACHYDPHLTLAYERLAQIAKHEGDRVGAMEFYEKMVAHAPNNPRALLQLGVLAMQIPDSERAIAAFERLLAIEPSHIEARFNVAENYRVSGRYDEAIAAYHAVIRQCETVAMHECYADAFFGLGMVYQIAEDWDSAITNYAKACEVRPDFLSAWKNHANILQLCTEKPPVSNDINRVIARRTESIGSYDKALAINPHDSELWLNRGTALDSLIRVDEAIDSYRQAVAINPDNAAAWWNLSQLLLLIGQYEEGFALFEWRWRAGPAWFRRPSYPMPYWLGEPHQPIHGKTILVEAEQGLGDTLQFCRYIPLLAEAGAKVVMAVQSPLQSLLKDLCGVERIAREGENASTLPLFDYHISMMSLPLALKTTLTNIPNAAPYIHAPPDKVRYWQEKLGKKTRPRVGLIWNSGYRPHMPEVQGIYQSKNISIETIAKINIPEVEFICLQKGDPAESEARERINEIWQGDNFINPTNDILDFTDTAAIMQIVDLVISVDTSTVHLAGAMGRPTWLLHRHDTCWRWMLKRDDNLWYPTMRLFRQPTFRDWDSVVSAVKTALTVWAQYEVGSPEAITIHQHDRDSAPSWDTLWNEANDQMAAQNYPLVYANCAQVNLAKPAFAPAWNLAGIALGGIAKMLMALEGKSEQVRMILAESHFRLSRATALEDSNAEFYRNLGVCEMMQGNDKAALARFDKAIAINPNMAEAWFGKGNISLELGDINTAVACHNQAVAINPNDSRYWNNRGNALKEAGHYDEAINSYTQALTLDPHNFKSFMGKGAALLTVGQYAEGFAMHESRWQNPDYPQYQELRSRIDPSRYWHGDEDIRGKTVLVVAEQGLGDTLQFCRYIPQLLARGAEVVVAVQPPVQAILRSMTGLENARFIRDERDTLPPFDYNILLLSLPHALRTTLATVPANVPYLFASSHKIYYWQEKIAQYEKGVRRPRVGLVWNGGLGANQPDYFLINPKRNMPLDLIAKVNIPEIDFYSLQKGEPAESEVKARLSEVWQGDNFYNFADELLDFTDTAGLIANLDLVISVDTSTLHLAGAMAKPVWLLNRYDTCWRWMLDRTDSPWYPTMRIFRQPKAGDWESVITEVNKALQEWLRNENGR